MKSPKRGAFLLKNYKVICVSNKILGYGQYGNFLIDPLCREEKLVELKEHHNIEEIMYITTSNREFFLMVTDDEINASYRNKFFNSFKDNVSTSELADIKDDSFCLSGRTAVSHVFCVASTMDSRGYVERGIVKSLKHSLETSNEAGLSGNALTALISKVVEGANMVFTKTDILKNRIEFDKSKKNRYGVEEEALHRSKWMKAMPIVNEYVAEFESCLEGMRETRRSEEYQVA